MKGRKVWRGEEKKIVLEQFHHHLVKGTLPGKDECLTIIDQNKCLAGRTWSNIKDFVRNHRDSLKKKVKSK